MEKEMHVDLLNAHLEQKELNAHPEQQENLNLKVGDNNLFEVSNIRDIILVD